MFKKLKIQTKLFLVFALPLLGLLYFALSKTNVVISLANIKDADLVRREVKLSEEVLVDLTTALQTGRAASTGFVATKGKRFADNLERARGATDTALDKAKQALEAARGLEWRPEFLAAVNDAVTSVSGDLPALRRQVSAIQIAPDEVLSQISSLVDKVNSVRGRAGELAPDPELYYTLQALVRMNDRVEAFARQRGLGLVILGTGTASAELLNEMQSAVDAGRLTARQFKGYATPVLASYLDEMTANPAAKEANAARQVVLDWPKTKSFGALTPERWLELQNRKVEGQLKVQKKVQERVFALLDDQAAQGTRGVIVAILLTLAILLAALIPAFLITRAISQGVGRTVTVLEGIANGDLTQRVAVVSQDEIGQLAQAINATAEALVKSTGEVVRIANMVESANMNIMMADKDELKLIYMNKASKDMFTKLQQHLPIPMERMLGQSIDMFHKNPAKQRSILANPNNLPYEADIQLGPEWLHLNVVAIRDKQGDYLGPMVSWTLITQQKANAERDEQVRKQVAEIARTVGESSNTLVTLANMMAANAEENSAQASNVSSAAEQVSHNVGSVATAIEEMTSTTKEIAKTVLQSSQVTQSAVNTSKRAGNVIKQLGESSQEIGKITKVITSIAQQTNILALNATIEAARAGEAGKGFAVVANEVKDLALETSKATDEIASKIEVIQSSATEVVSAVEEINRIMSEVDSLSNTVSSAVEEQSATTNEVSRSMTEASTGVNEIVKNISGVATAAQDNSMKTVETKSAAEMLGEQSNRLNDLVKLFEVQA
ncbi:MAG: nitrate- and nitrite sensing domain-containing protein [Candidatus Lambdaproteobacteria bacterium]|nr:nitrate- and nitrite sensing domain-containing protein [Candidatus Lambdaproteobacteria bacterium]